MQETATLRYCYISTLVLTCFRLTKGTCHTFSTRNNCCEFLASYGVNIQSVIQSYLKTPVFGASLSYLQVPFPSVFLLVNSSNFLQFSWFVLFARESSDAPHIRPEFSIFLCTEDGMLNATENAACNFFHFYWCSIRCSLTRYQTLHYSRNNGMIILMTRT